MMPDPIVDRLSRLDQQLHLALDQELERLDLAAAPLRGVIWRTPAGADARPRVAVVAADAGNVELRMAPLRISFVRVAASDRAAPLGEVVYASGLDAADLAAVLKAAVPDLVGAIEAADLDLREILRRKSEVNAVREVLEWGATLVAMADVSQGPRLVVRDGLLRSIHLEAGEFARIRARIAALSEQTGNRIVAVAKRVPGGHDMINSLLLAGVLDGVPPGPVALLTIPEELEGEFLPSPYVFGRRMHSLVLARLRASGAFVPIECAPEDLDAVVASLFASSTPWYPSPGMPLEVQVAHERAHITVLEMEWLKRSFLDHLLQKDGRLGRRALVAEVLARGGPGFGEEG